MASLFTTTSRIKTKIPFVGNVSTPFYLQFVPGIVVDVVTHPYSFYGQGDELNVNTIMAIPHITDKPKKLKSELNETNRYWPLFRGMFEVPARRDPVLLCTISGRNYYLGPINTQNLPNFNVDGTYQDESWVSKLANAILPKSIPGGPTKSNKPKHGFPLSKYQRLTKRWSEKLDDSKLYNSTHGDMLLEGRHGNSVRVGSRNVFPYVIISNGRPKEADAETILDGSLISITQNGSLLDHFTQTIRTDLPTEFDEKGNPQPSDPEKITYGFTLASDDVDPKEKPPERYMGTLISSINNDAPIEEEIYGYEKDQILISSDRITLNSKLDDIYISSNKDIHIGTKRHLSISTNRNLVIDSRRTYLGNPFKKNMDNMVLGKKLKEALNGIIDLIKEITITTQLGPQSPMPLPSESKVKSAIDKITSIKHFIEE